MRSFSPSASLRTSVVKHEDRGQRTYRGHMYEWIPDVGHIQSILQWISCFVIQHVID